VTRRSRSRAAEVASVRRSGFISSQAARQRGSTRQRRRKRRWRCPSVQPRPHGRVGTNHGTTSRSGPTQVATMFMHRIRPGPCAADVHANDQLGLMVISAPNTATPKQSTKDQGESGAAKAQSTSPTALMRKPAMAEPGATPPVPPAWRWETSQRKTIAPPRRKATAPVPAWLSPCPAILEIGLQPGEADEKRGVARGILEHGQQRIRRRQRTPQRLRCNPPPFPPAHGCESAPVPPCSPAMFSGVVPEPRAPDHRQRAPITPSTTNIQRQPMAQ